MADKANIHLEVITGHAAGSTSYVRTDTGAVYDYFLPTITAPTPDEYTHWTIETATGAGTTIAVAHYASVDYAIIVNKDGANFVTVTWDDANADTNTLVVAAGKFAVIPDFDPSSTFKIVADTGAVLCDVWLCGS